MSEYRKDDTASWDAREVRRAQEERTAASTQHTGRKKTRRRRRNPLLRLLGYLLFVALASALLASAGWMLGSDFCAFNRGALARATVEITAEDTVDTVAEKLEQAGLIKYKWFFKLYAGVSHADQKIGIGTYELNNEMDYRALILNMHNTSGNMTAETVTVTIPEGYTVAQTIRLLAEKGVNTEENLLEAAKTGAFDYSFIGSGEEASRLEGYLFPDTYEFYKNHNAKNALSKLIDAFSGHIDEEEFANSKAKAMGYSLKDVVIIASLIEKETDGTDHADIASVIYNRLQNPGGETAGLLQIDAALLYGLPDHTGAITNEDKAVDTPYNLYLHKGLPPTAIANPGAAALKAAMDPNDTGYYFYALGTDGKHHFSATLAEHNAFVGSSAYGG